MGVELEVDVRVDVRAGNLWKLEWAMASLVIGLCLIAGAVMAAEPRDVAFRSKLDGTEQRYVELLPPKFDPRRAHDVVIALHGHGADRWQFIRERRGECQGVRDVAAERGLIVISPDYRARTSWMGPAAEADVTQIIAEIKEKRVIDRVFVAGGSMGGTSALIFAMLHPDLIAGVCSLNGTANMLEYERFQDAIAEAYGGAKHERPDEYKRRSAELWPEKFTMPVAVTTGGKDEVVPPGSVLRLVEKLRRAKRPVLSLHRENGGHSTNYEDTRAAMEYMLRAASPGIVERQSMEEAASRLKARIDALPAATSDQRADVEVFHKGVIWGLRFSKSLSGGDAALLRNGLKRAEERLGAINGDRAAWSTRKGKTVRGFISAVDGSTQPYGVVVPRGYDGAQPMRLDVVLHGSFKPTGMSELQFMNRFDEGDADGMGPEVDYIELHPLGRVENCYRWAGETDVWEAIESACRNYRIDRDRIVLRGMSMGASGTWHLGLKHPDRFVALGPYCGYVDTHRFSETPIPGFIKVGPLPAHQELGLRMLDSVDYAANASVVPAIAAMGEKDVFFDAHVLMRAALEKEGLPMVNLISPGTGHVLDPVTHREQLRRIGEHADRGLDRDPKTLRFVTWTLKYNRCHWLELLGLDTHYERAEFQGSVAERNMLDIQTTRNITKFAVHRAVSSARIAGKEVELPHHKPGEALVFEKTADGWCCSGPRSAAILTGKCPGLQGPIDDAFTAPFVCVRGTGTPWNVRVHDWSMAALRRFEHEWACYMRGDLPVKDDTEIGEAEIRGKHLILFGDPGSNRWIGELLPRLPVVWTRDELQLGGERLSATENAPVLICPNPVAADRYVVINSGHTFHEAEFAAFNYLLFPRLGDWALFKVGPNAAEWKPGSPIFPDEPLRAGYFNESWQRKP
jgi:hypothetical protein